MDFHLCVNWVTCTQFTKIQMGRWSHVWQFNLYIYYWHKSCACWWWIGWRALNSLHSIWIQSYPLHNHKDRKKTLWWIPYCVFCASMPLARVASVPDSVKAELLQRIRAFLVSAAIWCLLRTTLQQLRCIDIFSCARSLMATKLLLLILSYTLWSSGRDGLCCVEECEPSCALFILTMLS